MWPESLVGFKLVWNTWLLITSSTSDPAGTRQSVTIWWVKCKLDERGKSTKSRMAGTPCTGWADGSQTSSGCRRSPGISYQQCVTPHDHLEVIVWLLCSGCLQRVGASPQLAYKVWRRSLCVFSLICLCPNVSLLSLSGPVPPSFMGPELRLFSILNSCLCRKNTFLKSACVCVLVIYMNYTTVPLLFPPVNQLSMHWV